MNVERHQAVIIGGGPAGLAAAIRLRQKGVDDVVVLEREHRPGGILRQCIHDGFGLTRFGETLSGPEYAQRFVAQAEELGITFPEEDLENYDTINGLLISRLDRIPGDDEQPEVQYLGYRFCVLKVENKMIHSVRVTKLPQALASEEK